MKTPIFCGASVAIVTPFDQEGNVNYAKLRFVISILGDIRVCGIAEETDKTVSIEVYKNAAKTNIELSETYKKLREQCIC